MKTNFIYLLLGVFITISLGFGANASGILSIKPAQPKQTITYFAYNGDQISAFINKNGKSFTVDKLVGDRNGFIVVMVRY